MDDTKMIKYSLGEAEGQRGGIIYKLKGSQRAKENFNRRIEDIGVRR